MKKTALLLLAVIGCIKVVEAQDFQGKVIYQSKTTTDLNLDGRQIPEEQKQRILERVKNATEQSFELSFDRTASLYVREQKLDAPSAGPNGRGGFRFAFAGGGNGKYYKNVQNQNYVNESELFGKQFLIKDSLINWEWKLGSETKKIGDYVCYKATAVRKADTISFANFRRFRGNNRPERQARRNDTIQRDSTKSNSLLSRIEAPKDRTITAWYAPEIPINQGPGPYWGLPGLILEVNDGRTAILCNKIVLNSTEKEEIKAPSKGKKVNQEEYDKILAEKMKEMSERFRNGNRRSGNGPRIRG